MVFLLAGTGGGCEGGPRVGPAVVRGAEQVRAGAEENVPRWNTGMRGGRPKVYFVLAQH